MTSAAPSDCNLPYSAELVSEHTLGMRVMPPTSRTSLISLGDTPASFMHALQGPLVRSSSGWTRDSNLARLMLMLRCLAPEASAVMKGRLMSV